MSPMSLWVPDSNEAVHNPLYKFELRIKRILFGLLDSKKYFKGREWGHQSQSILLETRNYF